MSPVETILSRLEGVEGRGPWKARCPAHDDRRASLAIAEGRDGRVLMTCHAGCSTRSVLDALSMTWNDLYADHIRPRWLISECYDYTDERGRLLFQSVRLIPKDFRQRVPVEGGWRWRLGDTRIVPYRLPRIIQAVQEGRGIFVVEGERDVHTLERLGLVATTNAGGAGKWRDAFKRYFEGATVYVVPDNDEAGRAHAQSVALSLGGVAKVRIVALDVAEKGDVTDYLKDHTVDDLRRCVAAASLYRRPRQWLREALRHLERLNGHDAEAVRFRDELKTYLEKIHHR